MMVRTYLFDGERDVSLHGEFDRRLHMRVVQGRATEAGHTQGGWYIEIADLLVELTDGMVARNPCAEGLLVHDAEAFE